MPRTKLDVRKNALQVVSDLLRMSVLHAGGAEAVSERLGFSRGTLYSRLKQPEKLTIDELTRLCRVTGVDMDLMTGQLIKILGG